MDPVPLLHFHLISCIIPSTKYPFIKLYTIEKLLTLFQNVSAYCLALINETTSSWTCHSKITRDGDFVHGTISRSGKFAIVTLDDYYVPRPTRNRITGICIFIKKFELE